MKELTHEEIDLIRKYLIGELTREESQKFDERIQKEEEFARQVEFQRELRAALGQKEERDIYQFLKAKQKKTEMSLFYQPAVRIAAAITILIISYFAISLYFPSSNVSYLESHRQLNLLSKSFSNHLGGGGTYLDYLKDGQYADAYNVLMSLCESVDCGEAEYNYYLGLLLLYDKKDYAQAALRLQKVVEDPEGAALFPRAGIYLARALAAQEKFEEAKELIPSKDSIDDYTRLKRILF